MAREVFGDPVQSAAGAADARGALIKNLPYTALPLT